MTNKLAAQKELIAGICDRLNMEYRELASVAGINPETMRKYAKGYQKMGDTAGLLLRHIEQEQLEARSRLKLKRVPEAPITSAYVYMTSEILDRNFKHHAAKLPETSGADRQHLLGNLRAMLDELDNRVSKKGRPAAGRGGVSSEPPSGAARLAGLAGGRKG